MTRVQRRLVSRTVKRWVRRHRDGHRNRLTARGVLQSVARVFLERIRFGANAIREYEWALVRGVGRGLSDKDIRVEYVGDPS